MVWDSLKSFASTVIGWVGKKLMHDEEDQRDDDPIRAASWLGVAAALDENRRTA